MKKSLIALVAMFIVFAPAAASAQTLDSIAGELGLTGRYIESGSVDDTTDAAIDDANSAGTAFVLLNANDSDADAQNILEGLLSRLNDSNSRYQSIVLYEPGQGVWAVANSGDPRSAIAAAISSFGAGDIATGLGQYTDALSGVTTGSTTATTAAGSGDSSTGSSGGGFSWLWILLLVGLVWLGFRFFNSRKAKKGAGALIEADRREIKEQLKDNADRVIDLGDAVIDHGDGELIRIYEEASRAYQDVSHEVDDAKTAEQVDALDDRIDKAEWQFEVIEARLEGRPAPAQPAEPRYPPPPTARSRTVNPRAADKPASRPAMDPDDSKFDERTTRSTRRPRRSSGGGLGGFARSGIGSVLLSLLMQFVMGGGLSRSRRSYGRVTGTNSASRKTGRGPSIQGPRGF